MEEVVKPGNWLVESPALESVRGHVDAALEDVGWW